MAVFVALFFGAITPNVYFGFLGVATFVGGVVLSAIALHSKHTTDIMLEVMHNGALLWCGSMLILSFTAMALPKLFGLVPGP
ncbi:MAG TPA: hypothetical protein VMU27_00435 [Candidatus Paceibacterota bacterium]|nr:hypothetical protein [Candidatus Paceibacterota bacterium]